MSRGREGDSVSNPSPTPSHAGLKLPLIAEQVPTSLLPKQAFFGWETYTGKPLRGLPTHVKFFMVPSMGPEQGSPILPRITL